MLRFPSLPLRAPQGPARKRYLAAVAVALTALGIAPYARAGVVITEFNSTSNVGNNEFVEFTNLGPTPVNMTGWSEDDSNRTPNKSGHSLSAFGTLQPGESAIFTEATPTNFRTFWWGSVAASPASLKIIGPYTNDNLSSSSDEINLYNAASQLIDRLTYPGTPPGGTANGVTRNPGSISVTGLNQDANWVDSFVGDSFHSFRAAGNPNLIGNPGVYAPAIVPEPATWTLGALAAVSLGLVGLRRRLRNRAA